MEKEESGAAQIEILVCRSCDKMGVSSESGTSWRLFSSGELQQLIIGRREIEFLLCRCPDCAVIAWREKLG